VDALRGLLAFVVAGIGVLIWIVAFISAIDILIQLISNPVLVTWWQKALFLIVTGAIVAGLYWLARFFFWLANEKIDPGRSGGPSWRRRMFD
jgi:hypothetical protein